MRKLILATVFGVLGLAGFSAAASACEGRGGGYTTYEYQQPEYGRRFERERFGRREHERERFEHRGRFERERFERR